MDKKSQQINMNEVEQVGDHGFAVFSGETVGAGSDVGT